MLFAVNMNRLNCWCSYAHTAVCWNWNLCVKKIVTGNKNVFLVWPFKTYRSLSSGSCLDQVSPSVMVLNGCRQRVFCISWQIRSNILYVMKLWHTKKISVPAREQHEDIELSGCNFQLEIVTASGGHVWLAVLFIYEVRIVIWWYSSWSIKVSIRKATSVFWFGLLRTSVHTDE